MKAILFDKIITNDSSSLSFKGLSETGEIKKFKFPGIAKSKKRNSYHITPGTIWQFSIGNSQSHFIIPKESILLLSPIDKNVTYADLERVKDLVKPLSLLLDGDTYDIFFQIYETTLELWQIVDINGKESLLNHLYCFFLKEMGFFNSNVTCNQCNTKPDKKASYILAEGVICQNCKTPNENNMSHIPFGWMTFYGDELLQVLLDNADTLKKNKGGLSSIQSAINFEKLNQSKIFLNSKHYRETIMLFLTEHLQ